LLSTAFDDRLCSLIYTKIYNLENIQPKKTSQKYLNSGFKGGSMAITGNFADFSFPELLQFLDQGKKTGLLHIQYSLDTTENAPKQNLYIWLYQGRVMGAADRLDQEGLKSMIAQRGWISERAIFRVIQISSCFINTPMGLCLKSQGLLQPEQLKMLFNAQVLRPISTLFSVKQGLFKFDTATTLPLGEMTGLSMSATEVILISLRSLRNWKSLEDSLPDPTSGLSSLVAKQPKMNLNAQEWQVWEFVDGQVSLEKIAHHLRIPVETVQQIAFRLIIVGLAEEYFMAANAPQEPVMKVDELKFVANTTKPMALLESVPQPPPTPQKPPISQSFLQNLVGFLRK
jgi:hypothetical protein